MQLRKRQQGLGLWGWIFVLGVIGFVTMVALRLIPIYLAEMSIERVVKAAADDPANGGLPLAELRRNMRTRWDVEGIETLSVNDVKITKTATGRALSYDYEARTELLANIALVVHFEKSYNLSGGGGVE